MRLLFKPLFFLLKPVLFLMAILIFWIEEQWQKDDVAGKITDILIRLFALSSVSYMVYAVASHSVAQFYFDTLLGASAHFGYGCFIKSHPSQDWYKYPLSQRALSNVNSFCFLMTEGLPLKICEHLVGVYAISLRLIRYPLNLY